MAAGSNNSRNSRTSGASKPYDISNSFVKRVASRVTEFLPPSPSWLSRWISPVSEPSISGFANHTHGLPSTITSRLPATSRADLNLVVSDDNPVPAKKQKISQYISAPVNQNKFSRSDVYGSEEISPIAVREPVPGPSTARPELIASTPALNSQQQSSNKVNGDDCSDSSESTSGCSSLVPQAQSSTRSLGGSRYSHMMMPQGSNMDYLGKRKPSFNTSTFISPLRSMRERVGSSPFYSGRTMYGGSAQTYLSALHATPRPGRIGVSPAMAPSAQQALPLSSTARRILDALEQFSTPVTDAKRMPVGTKRKLDATGSQRYNELSVPSTSDLLRVKRRERLQQSTSAVRQTAALAQPSPPSPVEYSIRKEEDGEQTKKKQTGKVKTKDKMMDDIFTEVKLPAASLQINSLPKIDIAIPPAPAVQRLVSSSSQSPAQSTGSKFVFSTPMAVPHSGVPPSPDCGFPPSPSFTFSSPISEINSARKRPVSPNLKPSIAKSSESPLARTLGSSLASDQQDDVRRSPVKDNRVKRKMSETVEKSKQDSPSSLNEALSSLKQMTRLSKCKKCGATTDRLDLLCSSCLKAQIKTDNTVNNTSTSECSSCKKLKPSNSACTICNSKPSTTNDFLSKGTSQEEKNNVLKTTKTSGFGDMFSKPSGTWECPTCMIHNKGEAGKCIACETPKPTPKKDNVKVNEPVPQTSTQAPLVSFGFGDKFKKPSGSWECQACMVSNNAGTTSCIACQTPKAGSDNTSNSKAEIKSVPVPAGNGFGDLFKKPAGSWACKECFVSNDSDKVKCIACDTVKPGATVPKETAASKSPKFSFGIPSTPSSNTTTPSFSFGNVSTASSTSITGPTFSFGIPKASDSKKVDSQQTPASTTTTSCSVATTSQAPTFSFGMPISTKSENGSHSSASNSTLQNPFQMGSAPKISTNSKSTPVISEVVKTTSSEPVKDVVKTDNMKRKATTAEPFSSNSVINTNPAVSTFGVKQEKSNPEPVKANNATAMFTFGSNSASKNETDKKASNNLSSNNAFMFGAQGGSSVASSTVNTMTASTASGVFKFGDTKTVSSGGHMAVSSATLSTLAAPKPNNLFSFGSSTEKKESFGSTGKEVSVTSAVNAQVTESKLAFSPFAGTSNTTQSFGNANNTFTSSNAFGEKEQQPNPFTTSTTNMFGSTETTNQSPAMLGFPSTDNTFGVAPQEKKPSALFTFGSTTAKESPKPGGFIFNPTPIDKPTFGFTGSQSTPGPSLGFGNTAPAPSTSFNFEPKFGTQFSAPRESSNSIFGTQSSQSTPAFGGQVNESMSQSQPAHMPNPGPVFAFGSQPPQPLSNPVFDFGSNQQTATAVAPATTFMFGASSSTPTPAATPAPAGTPAFDPNAKPTFNFSGGSTPVFSAIPTVGNPAAAPQTGVRKIRKAVRRTNISSVRQS